MSRWAVPGLFFSRFAWFVLAYTLLVILFGAWVRITGSGAGCGDHWPTCHGEFIPRAPAVKTMIEYAHRLTSGLLGIFALLLCLWAWLGPGRVRLVAWCASTTLLLVLFEALIGAGLVLAELVADDDSSARAWVVALHLGNTLVLTAAATLTAWFGAGNTPLATGEAAPYRTRFVLALIGVVLVSMTGAVTALGDTLFPVRPTEGAGFFAHLKDDVTSSAHFLVRLRVVHPILALAVGFGVAWLCRRVDDALGLGWARGAYVVVMFQMALGAANIALGAPGWLQLLHLLIGQILWVLLVLILASLPGARFAKG